MKRLFAMMIVGVLSMGLIDAAHAFTPIQYAGNVIVESHELDLEAKSVILKIQPDGNGGNLDVTFARDFFDSIHQNSDDDFIVIADGDFLHHTETKTIDSRTINLSISSNVDEVEIFGTQFLNDLPTNDLIIDDSEITKLSEKNNNLQEENSILTNQIITLSSELDDIKTENQILRDENEKLSKKIFELENLILTMEEKIGDLNSIIFEQVNVIITWIYPSQ